MGNPYRNVIGLVGVGPAVEREKHYAWEQGHGYAIFAEGRTITQDDYDAAYDKGHAEAKAEQAEIVSELVEVCWAAFVILNETDGIAASRVAKQLDAARRRA